MSSTITVDFTSMVAYTFGPFSLFPERFVLTSERQAHQLTPRLLAVLQYLIKQHNRVVTKDELIAEVWQGSFIEEGNVGRTVSTLRAMLGDVAENPTYIQTISRVGYRFICPVKMIYAADSSLRLPADTFPGPEESPPFVGREKELLLLKDMLGKCLQGTNAIACISGPPGIGKTALVEKFLLDAKEVATVAQSRCAPTVSTAEPYAPVVDAFTDLFNSCDNANTQRRLTELAPVWSSRALRVLGLPPSAASSLGSASTMNQQFGDAIQELSRNRPLVLFIDDFHWSDTETVSLIGYLSLRHSRTRFLLILGFRTAELLRSDHPFQQVSRELQLKGACCQIGLQLLSMKDVVDYLDLTVPARESREALARHVYMRCEGNPLFMISVLDSLKATEALQKMDGRWEIHADLKSMELAIPPDLNNLLRRSMEQLEADEKFLIRIASLQGLEFDSAILSNVSAMPAIEVEELLDELARLHEIIRYLGATSFRDGPQTQRYQFIHALLWKAFQDSVLPSLKKSLGLKIASAIGRRGAL
jgi:predicted ATPase/DNA-binding winged helix-turn-helix (wHTH) protein